MRPCIATSNTDNKNERPPQVDRSSKTSRHNRAQSPARIPVWTLTTRTRPTPLRLHRRTLTGSDKTVDIERHGAPWRHIGCVHGLDRVRPAPCALKPAKYAHDPNPCTNSAELRSNEENASTDLAPSTFAPTGRTSAEHEQATYSGEAH